MSSSEDQAPRGAGRGRAVLWAAAIVAVTLLARVPTARAPLDQDCAVYTYAAQRWAGGGLPYRDVWDHKPPFIYLVYRGMFAASPASLPVTTTLRLGSAAADALTALLVFLLARRLFGLGAGVVAGLLSGLFLGLPDLQLDSLQPERLVVLLEAAGILAAVWYADSRRYFWAAASGLLFGLALATKPIAAPVGAVVWAWLTWDALRAEGRAALRRVGIHSLLLAAGALLPMAAFAAYFAAKGAFRDFWFCTWTYNVVYAGEYRRGSLLDGLTKLATTKMNEHGFLWALAAAGAVVALVSRRTRRSGLLAVGWLAAVFLGVLLPGQFAYYYYVPTAGPLALCAGVAVVGLWRLAHKAEWPKAARAVVVGLCAAAVLALLVQSARREKGHYERLRNPKDTNAVAADLARHLAAATKPGDRLYVWGSRPQLYVLSGRQDVCPYLFNFRYNQAPRGEAGASTLYPAEMREKVMAGLQEFRPPFIVATETESLKDFPELQRYLGERYALEDRQWPGEPYSLSLYRRKDAP